MSKKKNDTAPEPQQDRDALAETIETTLIRAGLFDDSEYIADVLTDAILAAGWRPPVKPHWCSADCHCKE